MTTTYPAAQAKKCREKHKANQRVLQAFREGGVSVALVLDHAGLRTTRMMICDMGPGLDVIVAERDRAVAAHQRILALGLPNVSIRVGDVYDIMWVLADQRRRVDGVWLDLMGGHLRKGFRNDREFKLKDRWARQFAANLKALGVKTLAVTLAQRSNYGRGKGNKKRMRSVASRFAYIEQAVAPTGMVLDRGWDYVQDSAAGNKTMRMYVRIFSKPRPPKRKPRAMIQPTLPELIGAPGKRAHRGD